jgi:glycosyltransferase involved in cell wall biosynthesis
MAAGKPVVVSPVGMNKEVLVKGHVGFAATSQSDWIDALIYLFNNRDAGKEIGKCGKDVVEKYYSIKIIVKELVKIFKNFA